ncbi:MAG: hypothetical protein JWN41_1382 [Thermoleophilia bacterium]|nr:hypothetical protein [Thermoleophilia bacterium]
MANEFTIPQRLDWLLQQRGVSQNALARVSKVSPQTIANTLHHGRVPQTRTTRSWARALGVPTSFFTTKPLTEQQLFGAIEKAGAFTFNGATTKKTSTTTTRKAPTMAKATSKTTAKKPAAKKTTKTTKSTTSAASKTTTTAKAARKPVAKATPKATARPAVKSAKTSAKMSTTRAVTPKSKTSTAKKPTSTSVKYGTVKKATATARSTSSNGSLGVYRDALLQKLVKLSNSKQDAIALDATKTLLTYVK